MMRIIIACGTGFIETSLAKSLLMDGHQVWILTRNPETAHLDEGAQGFRWDGRTTNGWEALVSQVDAIVNLPVFALQLLLGEMSTLVLGRQYLVPKSLQELGFRFRCEKAGPALWDLLVGSSHS
jgi:NAD dependent epimerase/dehydratase family enzyme